MKKFELLFGTTHLRLCRKSLRLSGKFNAEEAEIIKKFEGRHKIKPNGQLVRKAVINYVELHMGIEALSSHPKFVKFVKTIHDGRSGNME